MTFAVSLGGSEPPPSSGADEVRALEEEAERLRHAAHAHAPVDQAIGVVIGLGGLSPQEAWDVLREVSMRTDTKLRAVAEQLVAWAHTAELPSALRAELGRQLGLRRQERAPRPTAPAAAADRGVPLPDPRGGER
ncbi:ANTAR domain-containing protein [Streptomyces sp. NPDC047071]|uniref:ANTAR domain-containing protein n=1 Tax=Streptomyces sp. NPDC047071 TaxID=3154808 RepID=UPI0034542CFA